MNAFNMRACALGVMQGSPSTTGRRQVVVGAGRLGAAADLPVPAACIPAASMPPTGLQVACVPEVRTGAAYWIPRTQEDKYVSTVHILGIAYLCCWWGLLNCCIFMVKSG